MSPYLFSTPLGSGSQQTKDCQSSSLEFHHPRVRRGPRLSATEVSLSPPKVVASFRRQSEISLRFRALARFGGNVSVAGIFNCQGSRRSMNCPFTIRGENWHLAPPFLQKSQNIFTCFVDRGVDLLVRNSLHCSYLPQSHAFNSEHPHPFLLNIS